MDAELETTVEMVADVVKKLYEFRDLFFENHDIDDASIRISLIWEELGKVLTLFDELEIAKPQIIHCAKYLYLKGYALNVLPSYNKEAEKCLRESIKRNYKTAESWNELGECYYKNFDFDGTEFCIKNALICQKNKVSLRNFSILSRLLETKVWNEKLENSKKSIELAKDAVGLDVKDGLSWMVLGNAYLHHYRITQDLKSLQQSLNAFKQSEKDVIAKSCADLHYNKGWIEKSKQNYSSAFEFFDMASQLSPHWDMPTLEIECLLQHLLLINESLEVTEKMKPKKLKQFLQTIEEKQLGHYEVDKYRCLSGDLVNLKYVQFDDLKLGINEQTVILGKVVTGKITYRCFTGDDVPLTFSMVDKMGTNIIVNLNICNMDSGFRRGDYVAIPEPFVRDFDFTYFNHKFEFRMIRVDSYLPLLLNRKRAIPEDLLDLYHKNYKIFK